MPGRAGKCTFMTQFTPEQLAQIIAAQAAAAQPQAPAVAAAPLSFAKPAPAHDPMLAALARANDPRDRMQTLSHPKDSPWVAGQRGAFDADYAITIASSGFDTTRAGIRIFKLVLTIDESSHPSVLPGTQREHALFQNNDAAYSETKGLIQKLYVASGRQGAWEAEPGHAFYYAITSGEGANPCVGLRFRLSISTEPQQKDARKPFTHYRYGETLAPGQSLGLVASQVPAPMAPVIAAPVAAPVAAAGGAPPWWPAGLPLPPGGVPF